MEIKKINKLLLGIFVLHITIVALATAFPEAFELNVILDLSLGELILFVPTLVYLVFWVLGAKNRRQADFSVETQEVQGETLWKRLYFNKVKPSTLGYVLLFTWLSMPLTTLLNAISMLFVDNTVVALSEYMMEVPFPVMLFLMAVTPAFCEEVVFRGVVYGGYRKGGNKFWAVILSGFMFGVMHGNLNQALYAFVIGVLLALLLEATGSIFTTMLFHFIYNAQSCCMMYLADAMMPGYFSEVAAAAVGPGQLYTMISVYLVLSVVFTPLAICVLYKISKNENRVAQLRETLPKHAEGKVRIATVSFWIASIVAVGYVIYDMVAAKLY